MNIDLSITTLHSLNYKLVKENVYVDLNDTSGFSNYRVAVIIKKEPDNFCKKKIERRFENNFLHIEKVEFCNKNKELKYVLGGDLEDIISFKSRISSRNIFIKGLVNAK
ncbi:hypothetical protein [Pseudofulvibacter geojedonensis]|uniref:Uncharacterized protein n=1 Tax=Pseudofulvibacter geojedonensis TaxID=1123758 RepID=A0ABW3I0A6_9FLAO